MAFGLGSFFGSGSDEQINTLDPAAQNALNSILNQVQGLQAQNPAFVAPFDAATVEGLQGLQDRPLSPFIEQGAENLGMTLGGGFFGANPAVSGFNEGLQGVEDSIINAATRANADQFSLAGRSGSPAQQTSLARTITEALAPFRFGAFENQAGREFGAFENERQRQLGGLSLAPSIDALQDSRSARLLGVGDVIQQQNQATLTEPLQAFEFFLNPLLSAAGGFPLDSTITNRASGAAQTSGVLGVLGSLFSKPSAPGGGAA